MSDVVNTPDPAVEAPAVEADLDEEVEEQEAELAADLEEIWQEESPDTARRTQVAEEVDGDPDTRELGEDA